MKSVMEHKFSEVPQANIERSVFDRSHGLKTTFESGYLVPIYFDEALPGDSHKLSINAFARLSTPIKPIMDNLHMDFFFFSVPLRLIWDNFQKFMGEQTDPGDSIDFTVPQVDYGPTWADNSIWDYFGLQPATVGVTSVSAFWSRAYNLIYNEWFRDQNLQDSVVVDKDDGPDTSSDYVLLRRGKRHDYFTSALPWPQKGDAVLLPLGDTAPVTGIGGGSQGGYVTPNVTVRETSDSPSGNTVYANARSTSDATGGSTAFVWIEEDPDNPGYPHIEADLSSATAITINELREAFQIQRMMERDARGGTRYTEIVKSHFGVTSPDSRLQRPEFLGGGNVRVNVNPVAQTSESGTTNQGNLAAFATAQGGGIGFNASFTEHCVLLGLVSVRADLTYQQGIERMWSRSTRYDYFWPTLAHLGEQEILNQEIFFDNATPTANVETWAYQERYAEYRYKPSKITGLFRSDATGSLDVWHLSEDFSSLPAFNASFIEDNTDAVVDRVIATPSEPQWIYDSYINLRSVRPMPVFGVPGLIDHF